MSDVLSVENLGKRWYLECTAVRTLRRLGLVSSSYETALGIARAVVEGLERAAEHR